MFVKDNLPKKTYDDGRKKAVRVFETGDEYYDSDEMKKLVNKVAKQKDPYAKGFMKELGRIKKDYHRKGFTIYGRRIQNKKSDYHVWKGELFIK